MDRALSVVAGATLSIALFVQPSLAGLLPARYGQASIDARPCPAPKLSQQTVMDRSAVNALNGGLGSYNFGHDASALDGLRSWLKRSAEVGLHPDEKSVEGLARLGELLAENGQQVEAQCPLQTAIRLAASAEIPSPHSISDAAEAIVRAASIRGKPQYESDAQALIASLAEIPGSSPRTLGGPKADAWGALALAQFADGSATSAIETLKTYDQSVTPLEPGRGFIALARAVALESHGEAARSASELIRISTAPNGETEFDRIRRAAVVVHGAAELLGRNGQCESLRSLIGSHGRNYELGVWRGETIRLRTVLLRCLSDSRNLEAFDRVANEAIGAVRQEITDRTSHGQLFHLGISTYHFKQLASAMLPVYARSPLNGFRADLAFSAMQLAHFDATTWTVAFLRRLQDETNPTERERLRRLIRAEGVFMRFLTATSVGDSHRGRNSLTAAEFEEIVRDWSQYAPDSGVRLDSTQVLLPLKDAQRRLATTDAVVVLTVGDDGGWIACLRANALLISPIGLGTTQLNKDVGSLRASVTRVSVREIPFDLAASHRLYEALFKPVEQGLEGARRVFWTPDGAMTRLPPGLLTSAAAVFSGRESLQAANWLAKQYAFVTLPTPLALMLRGNTPRGELSYLGVGDPIVIGAPRVASNESSWRGRLSLDDFASFPSLPETADEVARVARNFPGRATILLREQATERNVRALNLERYNVIHFATHGLAAGDMVGLDEPALLLSSAFSPQEAKDDGLLNASEIGLLRLNADLVILSACDTAAPGFSGLLPSESADPLSGFVRPFMLAGAKGVVVSYWAVDSNASVELITTMMQKLRAGGNEAEAMQQAMQATMANQSHPEWAHPRYWAPFALVAPHPY